MSSIFLLEFLLALTLSGFASITPQIVFLITSSNNIHSFIHNVDYWVSALDRYGHSFLLETLYSFLSEDIL